MPKVFCVSGVYNPRVPRQWRSYGEGLQPGYAGWYGYSPDEVSLSCYGPYATQREAENMPPMAATLTATPVEPITNAELVERDILACAYSHARMMAYEPATGTITWLARADRLEVALAKWNKAHEGRPFADRDLNE